MPAVAFHKRNCSKCTNDHCKGASVLSSKGRKCAETDEMESTTGVSRQWITQAVDVQTPIWSTGNARARPEPAAAGVPGS
jgi:hypothetical protein